MKQVWRSAALLAGVELTTEQNTLLTVYMGWLATEARDAGGIGPEEISRLDTRHIADSLLFGDLIETDHDEIWDWGSGVGLPGIPLGILFPQRSVVLIDRSGRRTRLAKRAVRVLDLPNVSVVQADVGQISGVTDVIVARASLPPPRLLPLARQHLRQNGVCLVGGSWVQPPQSAGWDSVQIRLDDLDRDVWILKMRQQ